jgi:anti-anti-sigma factor
VTALADVDGEHRGDCAIAHVRGEVDASNVRWIGVRVRALLTNHSHALAVDLSRATYLDSAGIALVFELAAELEQRRQRLVLVVADGSPIARMVSLTGLRQAVETFPTLADALAAVSSHAA